MCTEGAVIHEFLPTSDIFRVAEDHFWDPDLWLEDWTKRQKK